MASNGPATDQLDPLSSQKPDSNEPPLKGWPRLRRAVLGGKKDFLDPHMFHTMSLVRSAAFSFVATFSRR